MRKETFLGSQRGVGLITVLLIVAVLSVMGGSVAMFVATGSVAKTNEIAKEQAFGLAQAGIEYAFRRIEDGANPNGDTRTLGNGQFTIAYDQTSGIITVNTAVSSMYGTAAPSFSVQGPTPGGQSNCMAVNAAGAVLTNNDRRLQGITLRNNCQSAITIASMTVSWTNPGDIRMRQIRIVNTDIYNDNNGVLSGVNVNTTDYTFQTCNTVSLTYIRWDSGVAGKTITIQFIMSDNSTKSAIVSM